MTVQSVNTAHEKTLGEKAQESPGCGTGCYGQEKAVCCFERGKAHVAADHEIGTVGKIDNAHQPEHQTKPRSKEKKQHAEGNPVEYLGNGYGQFHGCRPPTSVFLLHEVI